MVIGGISNLQMNRYTVELINKIKSNLPMNRIDFLKMFLLLPAMNGRYNKKENSF